MSRSTQFIGLTERGQKFVESLERVSSNKHATDMFGEDIPLGCWNPPKEYGLKATFIQEVVQEVVWSSGPMIFTRLDIEFHKSDGQVFTIPCFEWTHDPGIEAEFSYAIGAFWV